MTQDIEHGAFMHRDFKVHNQTVDEMVNALGNLNNANLALVGKPGVGKTTTVYSFTQRILTDPKVPGLLRFKDVYMLDANTLLAEGKGKMEQLLSIVLAEASRSKKVILFFDDAKMFFEEGTGATDLANVLRPLLENSPVPMIFAFSEQSWQELSNKHPELVAVFNKIVVPEADKEQTVQILEDYALLVEGKFKVVYTYQALVTSYNLGSRYQQDLAFPGKAIKVMEGAASHAVNGVVDASSVEQSIEATHGVKVSKASAPEGKQLLNLEKNIHAHMINQTRAVKVVSDALRRSRSGVANQEKPIGAFLFLGPTGVGKTELSKSLARVYFGSTSNMIRLDMNSFVSAQDVQRLLDTNSPNSLLNKVSTQPFSVVLLDEIEKANSEVVNVFLQMLDEGVMRDANNKEVSFRDCIIIATSNAGAVKIRQLVGSGQKLEDFEESFVNELINSNQFAPEFLNRFDEVVLFRPLDKSELAQVVDLMMKEINKTLENQKVTVELADDAKQWVVDNGYDPRLGARPMRRVLQNTVENTLAKKVLSGEVKPGSKLSLSKADITSRP